MIKKIAHLADYHCRTNKMHDEFREFNEKFFLDVEKSFSGLEYNERRIVIAGDIVHNKLDLRPEQIKIVGDFFNGCVKIAPVVLIPGNHDLLLNNKDRLDSLTPIVEMINNPNIKYYTKSECYLDDNVVWCNYAILEDDERPDIESAKKQYGNDKKYIGLFHGALAGSKTDLGYEISHGHSLEMFEGLDACMMGDIHKRGLFLKKEEKIINEKDKINYINNGWQIE